MDKKKLTLEVIERLKKEYPEAKCTLDYDKAWQLLVSVRLAAQCTDERVNVITEKLFSLYPDVAALAADTGVIVLAFILMSNHVHFVLVCTKEEAEEFIRECKRRYSKYYQRKYGISKLLKKNGYDVSFKEFMKIGLPLTLTAVLCGYLFIWFVWGGGI